MNTQGIAPESKKSLSDKLKRCMFSLNVDEAPKTLKKILNVMGHIFDDDDEHSILQTVK